MSALKAHGAGPLPGYGASNRSPLPTQHNVVPFSGIIAATTFDHKVAFVRLDAPAPAEFAVISSTTEGRVNLMNGHGRLEKNTRVTGTAELGGESLHVVTVSPEAEAK